MGLLRYTDIGLIFRSNDVVVEDIVCLLALGVRWIFEGSFSSYQMAIEKEITPKIVSFPPVFRSGKKFLEPCGPLKKNTN